MAKKSDDDTKDVEVSTDVEISTDAEAGPDLSTGEGVGDVDPANIPNILDSQPNLPPEVRAALVERHPTDPGAHPAPVTVKEQPMPVVTGLTAPGGEVNDAEVVTFLSDAHPELVVWHPNGDNTVQFHNGRYATAQQEWIAVLDRTPEVNRAKPKKQDDAVIGADVEPIRATDVVPS